MLSLMICQIKDKRHFWEHFQKAQQRLPEGASLVFKYVSENGKTAWIMWNCDSEMELRRYLAKMLSPFSSSEWHQVDDKESEHTQSRKAA